MYDPLCPSFAQSTSQPIGLMYANSPCMTGQTLLWQYPSDYDSPGLEYKVLPSGAHAIDLDYVYVCIYCNAQRWCRQIDVFL